MSRHITRAFVFTLWCAVNAIWAVPQNVNGKVSAPTDPLVGTWKLNLAQSQFSPVLLALQKTAIPKERTEIYRLVNNRIELTQTSIRSDGSKEEAPKLTWPAQGGAVVSQSANGLSYVETLIASGEWLVSAMLQDGTQVGTLRKIISKDGKTMRQITKGVDPQGKPFEQVQVFDRQ
jgi:hypothetical protein